MINKLFVEYPPGSGGSFLKSVLICCTNNLRWVSKKRVNFHNLEDRVKFGQIQGNHLYAPATNIISIDSPEARYNFWINYFKKCVVYELKKYTYQGKRWIKCPYEELDCRGDAFWLLNQCRFIIGYQNLQMWKIDWTEMLQNPETPWKIIQEFLDANHQPNHWQLDQWVEAVNDYKQTVSKIKINTNHVSWQIWATALLQEQEITPAFDLIDNFQKPQFFNWLDNHRQTLVEKTEKCTWLPG